MAVHGAEIGNLRLLFRSQPIDLVIELSLIGWSESVPKIIPGLCIRFAMR
jgi:hypothetical protein